MPTRLATLPLVAALAAALTAAAPSTPPNGTPGLVPNAERDAAPGALGQPARADTLWLYAADPTRDAVHKNDTEATLVRRYGRANVKRDSIPAAEGESVWGTVLFPNDSARTLYVYWDDDAHPFRRVDVVTTGPGATAWMVAPGVAVGTRLADLERLNGRPFRLFGFEWDYGGNVTSWRGGQLGALWDGKSGKDRRVVVRLNPYGSTRGVSGEGEFSSALPAMRRADARVGVLTVTAR